MPKFLLYYPKEIEVEVIDDEEKAICIPYRLVESHDRINDTIAPKLAPIQASILINTKNFVNCFPFSKKITFTPPETIKRIWNAPIPYEKMLLLTLYALPKYFIGEYLKKNTYLKSYLKRIGLKEEIVKRLFTLEIIRDLKEYLSLIKGIIDAPTDLNAFKKILKTIDFYKIKVGKFSFNNTHETFVNYFDWDRPFITGDVLLPMGFNSSVFFVFNDSGVCEKAFVVLEQKVLYCGSNSTMYRALMINFQGGQK